MAEELERIAIFPFKTSGIQTDSSFIFVDSLRNYVRKSKQYEIMEYEAMIRILSYKDYKGDILCYDDECAFVMGEFLSLKKVVQGFIKKRRDAFSVNIHFLDLEKEEIILDVTEHFKGTFKELLENKIPKFAEMINWSTKYLNKRKQILRNKKRDKKKALRILFGITSLGAVGGGAVMNYFAEEKIDEYESILKDFKDQEDKIRKTNDITLYNSLNKKYMKAYKSADLRMKARNVLYFLAGTGAICFSITFYF